MGAAACQQGFDQRWKVDEGQVLGREEHVTVYMCTQRCAPEKHYIFKEISTELADTTAAHCLKRELKILKALGRHQDIVSLVDHDKTSVGRLRLVLEFCEGGVLYDRIKQLGRYPERDARLCCTSCISGVAYIHSKGIMHRDLKVESILLTSTWSNSSVKISDFGLAKIAREFPKRLPRSRTFCGSDFYIAPEVIEQKKKYGREVDMWALGVVAFAMLTGMLPFYHTDLEKVFHQILRCDITSFGQTWAHVSIGARDLITRLLKPRPSDRLTAEQALSHRWLRSPTPAHSSAVTSDSLLVGESALSHAPAHSSAVKSDSLRVGESRLDGLVGSWGVASARAVRLKDR